MSWVRPLPTGARVRIMQTAERTHSEALYFQGPLQLLGSELVGTRERFAIEENVQGHFLQAI